MTDSVAANGPELTWGGGATKKGKANLTTKDTKSTKFINQIISEPFVAFVIFVVRRSFIKCCIHDE